ncbi:MAG: hypothetical protein ACO1RT_15580 [Planctomycetaceae bacterium]
MNHVLSGRRAWLTRAAGIAAAGLVANDSRWAQAAAGEGPATDRDEPVRLEADASQSLFRVRVEMDVQGQVNIPKNALVSKEKAAQFPLKAKSVLDWEERILGFADDRTAALAERHYHEATSEGTSGKNTQREALRKTSRYLRVTRQDSQWLTYSPDSYLSGAELDLLELPASSLAVDALLPTVAVRVGDTYQPSKHVLAKLLSLASVDSSEVTAEINAIADDSAKIHLQGKLLGSIAGVPTTIDLVGKLVFDRQELVCNWLVLAIHEQREIGKSEPGFDVAATIKMIRKPLQTPTRLSSIPPASVEATVAADRLYSELSSTAVGFTFLMDRRWKMMSDAAGASMIRMIENDRGIAQCDIRPAGAMAPGSQLTMQALIADVKQSLGNRFGQLLESHEEVNEFGLRVLRVSTQGAVEGVPVQWVFLHFSDDSGRRLLATMTVGGNELDAFAGADVQLGASLRFIPIEDESPEVATAASQPAIKK